MQRITSPKKRAPCLRKLKERRLDFLSMLLLKIEMLEIYVSSAMAMVGKKKAGMYRPLSSASATRYLLDPSLAWCPGC